MVFRWFRSLFSASKKLIGTDHLGNKYFEYEKVSGKKVRSFEAALKHEDYNSGFLPPEWEAWLSWRSHHPPTVEEIEKRITNIVLIKNRAAIKAKADDESQLKAIADGLIAKEKSIKEVTNKQSSKATHSSTSNSFEPEAWKPGQKS
ncbi:NADH dehydrogenase [ubiquinone] 1 alpha subcomplex assembly factor 2 isoform X3 [Hydra vulgaris]|uniref:NADH dehydrogenase [ubiquinone] 1 alpha subcomplex assembly factor 2 isoform X3 n=1 Tax=Hydra vulgaris TaxID=6087 RepID=A0ABM4C6C3_HYDVU